LEKDVSNLTDINGKHYFREFRTTANEKGKGWIEYMWRRPGEKAPRYKKSYIVKVPNQDIYIGAGYYPHSNGKSPPPKVGLAVRTVTP
jgi:signal transduction histidine kinase